MRRFTKCISLMMSLILVLGIVPFAVTAEALQEGDFSYAVNGDGQSVTVTAYTGSDAAVTVPSTLGGLRVTAIGEAAFESNITLTSVSLPTSIDAIGSMAFYNCSSLTTVETTPYLLYVGDQAFTGTAYLSNFEDGPVYVGRVLYTYKGIMPANTTIEVKAGTASISPYAFYRQSRLKEIYLPIGMRTIGDLAFMGCTNLLKMRVPNSVKNYGEAILLNAGGNVSVYGASGSAIDAYCEENGLFFVHDEELNFLDGDVTMDGAVDSRDLRLLMRAFLYDDIAINADRLASCDFVYDGTINSADVRGLLCAYVGA
ncbi:MAG: leucine-rich repeat protein [Clostridia bacterium]|nr:leucine-rich repeat protein [Clostridia bacterium]